MIIILAASCVPEGERNKESVSGETSGTLSRLYLSPAELKSLEDGGRNYFRKQAGDPPPDGYSGGRQGDFMTANYYASDYTRIGQPRTMRGTTEDLAILPYRAKILSSAGGAEYRSYLLATRSRGTGRWSYSEGFSVDAKRLYKRFPGLKETNAVPGV